VPGCNGLEFGFCAVATPNVVSTVIADKAMTLEA